MVSRKLLSVLATCVLGLVSSYSQLEGAAGEVDYAQRWRDLAENEGQMLTLSQKSESAPGTGREEPDKNKTGPLVQELKTDDVQLLRDRIIEVQNRGKLGFRKVILCGAVEGFGIYSPLEHDQQVPRLILYVEPENVSTLSSNDRYVVDCSVSFGIMDPNGRVLFRGENLKFNKISRSPILDLHYKIVLNPKKLGAGELLLKMTIHDKIKNQSASIIKKFSLHAAKEKQANKIRSDRFEACDRRSRALNSEERKGAHVQGCPG